MLGSRPCMRGSLLLASAFALTVLSGCVVPDVTTTDTATYHMPLDIHIVAVGFSSFDTAQLASRLRQPDPTFELVRAFTTANLVKTHLQFDVHYIPHIAPAGFTTALFEAAAQTAKPAAP